MFEWKLSICQPLAPKYKFRFKNPLSSIDTITINLCLSLFNLVKFLTTKGIVKLYVKLNHADNLPTFSIVRTGKENEQNVIPQIPLEKGDIAVFYKDFTNFTKYWALYDKDIYFVTSLKKKANFHVINRRVNKHLKNISSDQIRVQRLLYEINDTLPPTYVSI